ncbi:hypothetical protein DFH27DRAFT_554503 [Peziza echinospora]|nr:hypothetical protein DFH27DRAFT_554503 [Peziza echinospora]
MVLSEVEKASPGSLTDAYTDSGSGSGSGSDSFPDDNGQADSGTPRNWTVDSIKSLIAQHQVYPDPFTPIPFYARIIGWSDKVRDLSLATNVNRTQTYIARQLNPTEVQAEAYYHSVLLESIYKSEAIGLVSLLGLAAVRQSAGRPGLVTPYAQKYMGKVPGDWYIRLSRYAVYGFFGRLQGQFFGAILGANAIKEQMKQDPNVQALRRDLNEFRIWSEEEIRRRAAERKRGVHKPLIPTPEEIKNRPHIHHNQHRGSVDAGNQEMVDGSDDAGFGSSDASAKFPGISQNTLLRQSENTPADPLYGIVPSASPESASDGGSSTLPGQSAWDRLRRQQQRPPTTTSASDAQPASPWVTASLARNDDPRVPKTDSFTFSASDEDRQQAQIEAQREFDARVERERSGGIERGFSRQGSDEGMMTGDREGGSGRGRSM